MARFRLSTLAKADLAHILAVSEQRWGAEGRRRYREILSAAMRNVARDPAGPLTRERSELARGMRSFHVRHARGSDPNVKNTVHVLFYRTIEPGLIEIVGVLHERMEPRRHVRATA